MSEQKREAEVNLALLNAMADDPDEFGFTEAQGLVLAWAELYIRSNWNPKWEPEEE